MSASWVRSFVLSSSHLKSHLHHYKSRPVLIPVVACLHFSHQLEHLETTQVALIIWCQENNEKQRLQSSVGTLFWRAFHYGQTEEFVPEILGMASALGSSIFIRSICPCAGSVVSYQALASWSVISVMHCPWSLTDSIQAHVPVPSVCFLSFCISQDYWSKSCVHCY